MDDIATKFEYLKETKNLIKQAIIDKGVTVSDTDTFRSYADKISSIENTTSSVVATDDVCRKNLCYWMDAIDNRGIIDINGTRDTKAGNWWSKSGFCYFAPTKTGTWNEDSITLNNTYHGYYETNPLMKTYVTAISEMTYEITFSFNSFPSSDASMLIGSVQSGGWVLHVLPSGRLRIYYYVDRQYYTLDGGFYFNAPLNTKLYLCGRIKNTGIVSMYSTICGLNVSNNFTGTLSVLNSAITVGYNGDPSGAYESQQSNINVSSFRIYNRYITDEEMLANCKYEVDRFNIPEYRILTINSNVEGATVILTANGYTQTDNYIKVLKGTEVAYSVSADGYTTQTGTITVNDTQTIDITL